MLRRLTLRDFVIVPSLALDFHAGFSALTGETGAGKSILVDALQLALGSRADALVVREGCARAEISAEFDPPASLTAWLDEAGFAADDGLLLRRTVDAQGKSRAWINGSPATVGQLREAAEALVDIHGQHAWQSLTRPAAVRELLDTMAGIDTSAVALAFADRRVAAEALKAATEQGEQLARERERLAWQLGELDKLAPAMGEWHDMSAEHQRLAHAQALMEAARSALDHLADADTGNAEGFASRAQSALVAVVQHDESLQAVIDTLDSAMVQLQDAAHVLNSYLGRAELDPQRLDQLDMRMSEWMGLARRWRKQPDELPATRATWQAELRQLDLASDLAGLEQTLAQADARYRSLAGQVSQARNAAAKPLAASVSQVMQDLGMAGGRFEVQLSSLAEPQAHGLESVEFLVAGHAGASPRPLSKVASGGELSRLALAIAVTAVQDGSGAQTLIFDEIDAGIGGAVGDTVGALMKRLGGRRQVLAVTHLAQVAACADHHYVVAKNTPADGRTASTVQVVQGQERVSEVARMLGGERMSGTSEAHALAMLQAAVPLAPTPGPIPGAVKPDRQAVTGARKRSKA